MSELRDLLDREARRIQGGEDALDSVLRRTQRKRRTRRVATGTLALTIAAVGSFGAYRAFRPRPIETEPSQAGTSEVFEGIWPETGADDLAEAQRSIDEGHQPWRTDPVETARAFATNVLQWKSDRVEAEILGWDHPTAVLVQILNRDAPKVEGDLATLITVERLGREDQQGIWSVIAADGGLIRITAPPSDSLLELGAPLNIEGQVSDPTQGISVEAGLFAGEGGIPFDSEGSIAVRRFEVTESTFAGDLGPVPEDLDGSLILIALARDRTGSIIGASARRVTIATPETSTEVLVYFSPDQDDPAVIEAVKRSIPQGVDPVEGALRALLRGPTEDERARGLDSLFYEKTAALLNFVSVEDGLATVDLSGSLLDVLSKLGAQAPAHAAVLFSAQLDATLFQFPAIERIQYQLDGSCEAFANWIGYGCTVARPSGVGSNIQLPPAVAAKRDAILEAAAARKYEALRRLITPDNFTFSYGGGDDPVAFWKELEQQGEDPLHTLHVLLTMPYVLDESGIYVWPSLYASDAANLTEEEIRLARRFATQEEIDSWREFGLYFGYRVGIDSEGNWIFFVAGD